MQQTLQRIKKLQDKMGYTKFIQMSLDHRLLYTRDITLALQVEISEFLDELPWKPWLPVSKQTFNKKAAALELCDVFIFCFVLYLTIDPAIALEDAMAQTLEKVEKRVNKFNYGLVPKE